MNSHPIIPSSEASAWAAPGEHRYNEAIASFNLAADVSPQFALTATTVSEVQDAVGEAVARGLSVRVHSTGHSADGGVPFDGEVLIRTNLDGGVTVDPEARTAVIPAGTVWGDVLAATAPHGLVPLHGTSSTVGAVGYLLRGGVSFYGRKFGVASNSIVSISVVIADGSVVTVDHVNDRELFDALRGGGGGFGVVVSVTVGLFAVDAVFTGATFWPVAEAEVLLRAWEAWAATAPNAASTAFRVLNLPPVPGIPPMLTQGPVVCIDGAMIDDDGRSGAQIAAELLDPLRAHAAPLLDTWHPGPVTDVPMTHMDPPTPAPSRGDHLVVTALGDEGRAALLSIAGQAEGASLAIVELRQLGGALAHPDERGGVVNSLSGSYGLYSLGIPMGPNTIDGIAAQLGAVRAAMSPWDTGVTIPTFVDRFDAPQKSFDASVAAGVDAVRRRVDPTGIFRTDVVRGARV